MTWVETFVTIATSGTIASIATSLIVAYRQKHKDDAEAAEIISGAALRLLEPLQQRIDELEDQVMTLEHKLQVMTLEVSETRAENIRLKMKYGA